MYLCFIFHFVFIYLYSYYYFFLGYLTKEVLKTTIDNPI